MPDNDLSAEALNEHTRDVYHKQHVRQGEDDVTRKRLMSITSEEFFQVDSGFFQGKSVLDAGCGSIVRNAIAFVQMGAKDVVAMDLGTAWFETARKNMSRYSIQPNQITLQSGSVTDLPFEDGRFDFVSCDGVLPHLADEHQVRQTLAELSRVTRPGGNLFVSFLGGGGLIETYLHDAARKMYKESPAFAALIDNIEPETLHQFVDFAFTNVSRHNREQLDPTAIKALLDEDLCIAIQNLLQAQRREHHRRDFVTGILQQHGFGEPTYLKRYVVRQNIRKFAAPFHYYSDNPMARILYGDGWIDCRLHKND